jgi:hypothetical protein
VARGRSVQYAGSVSLYDEEYFLILESTVEWLVPHILTAPCWGLGAETGYPEVFIVFFITKVMEKRP